tara:strand:- start:2489 stop:3556 length:1068 start_codon:yes stop_codon:yes gene_type:complete
MLSSIPIFNNIKYREKCIKNLPLIKNIIISPINIDSDNETVFIDFRWFPHIEYLVRNTIIKLPNWKHTIVCGNNNIKEITQMCINISFNIKIIHLNIDCCSIKEYSKLLLNKEFWNKLSGEKILIYQEDSFLFHGNIEPFLKYDYIGAPWPYDFLYEVGNGGFSLRTRKLLIEMIDKFKPENKLEENEDIFFVKNILKSKQGLVASRHIALQFSEEYLVGKNPVGGHKFDYNSLSISYKCLSISGLNKIYYNKIIQYGLEYNIFNQNSECIVLNYNLKTKLTENIKWIAVLDEDIYWNKTILHNLSNCLFIINISKYIISDKITSIIPEYIIKYPKTYVDLKIFYDFILRKINNI